MRWEIVDNPSVPKRCLLNLHAQSAYDPSAEHVQATMQYEGWLLGGCSTAGLWGFSNVPSRFCTEDVLAALVAKVRQAITHVPTYNPHMVFCQVPAAGVDYPESPFFKLFRETIYPDVQPVFTYPNRSHLSTEQRLYYFDTDVMFAWLEKYHAVTKPAEEKPAVPVVPNVGNVANAPELQRGTIIADHARFAAQGVALGQGQRPIAPGEYFAALARR